MSLDTQTLVELKESLVQEKERIEDELGRIAKPTKNTAEYTTTLNDFGDDEDENASEVEEYTDNIAVETTLEKQLEEIEGALKKIEVGAYGKCEKCNADIPLDRLRAYPAARTCFNC